MDYAAVVGFELRTQHPGRPPVRRQRVKHAAHAPSRHLDGPDALVEVKVDGGRRLGSATVNDDGRKAALRAVVREGANDFGQPAAECFDDVDDGAAAQYTTDRERITAGIVCSMSLRSPHGDQSVT